MGEISPGGKLAKEMGMHVLELRGWLNERGIEQQTAYADGGESGVTHETEPTDPGGSGTLFFDTVTLSNFALAGRIDLLVERYGSRARVTPEVPNEVLEGIVAGYFAPVHRISDLL